MLFKPVGRALAFIVLVLRLLHLFFGALDLAQVPLDDLRPVIVHLVRSVDELADVEVTNGCRVKRQVRHQTHVVELAYFALLLLQLDLISHFLLVGVGESQLSRERLPLLNHLLSQVLHQSFFQFLVFFCDLLSQRG